MDIFVAVRNSDLTEGSGHDMIIGIFSSPDLAFQAAEGWGVMGVGDGDVYKIPIFENIDDFKKVLTLKDAWMGKKGLIGRHPFWFNSINKIERFK